MYRYTRNKRFPPTEGYVMKENSKKDKKQDKGRSESKEKNKRM
jgi:hypothetical protein